MYTGRRGARSVKNFIISVGGMLEVDIPPTFEDPVSTYTSGSQTFVLVNVQPWLQNTLYAPKKYSTKEPCKEHQTHQYRKLSHRF